MKVRDALDTLREMNPDSELTIGIRHGDDEDFVPVFGFEPDTTTGRPLVAVIPDATLRRKYPLP